MRQKHIDYQMAVQSLGMCVYRWEATSYAKVIQALKEGKIGGRESAADDDLRSVKISDWPFAPVNVSFLEGVLLQ